MKTLIIGLDAFDPQFFEGLHEQGKLPNLSKFIAAQGYSRFQVANPPQSEVSWTSIATGLDPSGHGMFDFVHRDPASYALHVSLLPTGRALGGIQFIRPYNAQTIFDVAAERGYSSTSLWWPATFPARPDSPVRSLPGLGTPDIQGRLGVGMLFTSDSGQPERKGKTPVRTLKKTAPDRYAAAFEGPLHKTRQGMHNAALEFELLVKNETSAELRTGGQVIPLTLGQWSPIIEIRFKLGLLASVHAITRLVLTQVKPYVQVYALPLQIHPLHPLWRYGTPGSFVKDAWQSSGPFLTLGWPQDTTGLEDGCISDEQFLALCESIDQARAALLFHLLPGFREGLLASVFDTLDRVQHMFWRDRPDIIESWYLRLDRLVGEIEARYAAGPGKSGRLVIVSDHGFKNLHTKVNLNRWLIDQGFLAAQQPAPAGDLKNANWSATQAYAIGLNSLYLNLEGREGQGSVPPAAALQTLDQIRQGLLAWKDPDGHPVVQQVWRKDELFSGPLAAYGPDLLVGYTPGFRASAETGLGAWAPAALESNHDHWGADHCFDPSAVPGVLFASRSLAGAPEPSFREFPALAIDATPDAHGSTPPPQSGGEDQEKVEERLRSLGYL